MLRVLVFFFLFTSCKMFSSEIIIEDKDKIDKEVKLEDKFSRKDSLRGFLFPERTCFDVKRYDLYVSVFPDKKFIQARVYERGVGETNACGSGALCMFYYLYDNNRVENNSIIIYPGGELEMSIKDHKIHLKGQVTYL